MSEPTQEELQKFWEHFNVKPEILPWSFHYGGSYPALTLDNLFKYAVPKLTEVHEGRFSVCIYDGVHNNKYYFDDKPELALFKAIQEAIK